MKKRNYMYVFFDKTWQVARSGIVRADSLVDATGMIEHYKGPHICPGTLHVFELDDTVPVRSRCDE